jgi:hypothetical protein
MRPWRANEGGPGSLKGPPSRPTYGAHVSRGAYAATLLLAATGCGGVHGPSLEVSAPRVEGRAVDSLAGTPVARARVARSLAAWRLPTGGFPRGAEEFLVLQDEVRTGPDGRFALSGRRVALLFSIGDPGLNLGLAVRHGRYRPWQTNYPMSSLALDPREPRIDAGDIPLTPR